MSWPLLNILELHHPEDTEKSSVRAFGGFELNKLFDELCKIYVANKKVSYKKLADEIFKVNPNSIQSWRGKNQKYKGGHPIPLWALKRILQINNLEFDNEHKKLIKTIKYLQCGRVGEKVRAEIYLTPELARICGAHAADGCLNALKGKGPLSARWDLGDQEKSNILEAKIWIDKTFNFSPVLMQKGKMSYIWSNRQVLSRYLTRIFDFPIGRKTEIVEVPKILINNRDKRFLENSELNELQLAFAMEVINFDGHSTLSGRTVQVGLGVNSKKLLYGIANIFEKFYVNFHIYDTKILTTSYNESKKLYSLGLFRGQKREKFERLILQRTRKAEKQP